MGIRFSRWTTFVSTLLCAGILWAGPVVSVMDTAAPPQIDGSLSDWSQSPDIVLDQAEDVVIGKGNWTGPETASAKIRITYDKKNLFISADMLSKTSQYNAQEGANIYNGDALELYLGTDLTNPQRKSYEPTDVQVFISPGKNGEGAQVYSATDKAQVPGAQVATKLSSKGYTLEASIPLSFLYKLDVGPGKSIGLDIAMDDVGPVSKSRTLQLAWSRSSMGWQDPSVWGTLTFKGKTTYVNKSPKVAMPGAVSVEMDPQSGKKGASTLGMLIWGFEGGEMGGFKGKLSADSTIVSEGAGSLRVDTKGSSAWNQNLAKSAPVPHAAKWKEFKAITMDVYCPKGSIEPTGYTEIFMITSGATNSWYQAMKVKLKEGWNRVRQDVDSNQWAGGVNDVYLVFNSGGPIQGEFIIDNVRGILKGAPAVLKGKVAGKAGEPVAGAMVAVDRKLVKSGKDGSFRIPLPEDSYLVEVFAPGFQPLKKEVMVSSTKTSAWKAVLTPEAALPKVASADVHFEKRVRSLDLHYLLGNNIADWHQPVWLSDPAAIEKVRNVFTYIRVPGGGHSNIWRWKTGQVLRKDGTVQEVQAAKWSDMVGFLKAIPDHEVLMCANIMTEDVQNTLDWIADAKSNGLNIKYVELGNEPDYEAELVHNGQTQYWSVIDNYSRHYIEFAKAIKARYPELKIMGPTPSQFQNHERKEGSPWLAPETAPWWVGRFLENCGPYVDVLSIHTYPYWSNDSDANLLSKTSLWSEWIPKIRESIRKNVPDRADKIEIAVTEWNSGDENATTAKLVNAIFSAEYLAQMMIWGVNQTNIWDMYTLKPGLGGGHGVLDPTGDPDRPYAERSAYWALYMFRHFFGNTLHQAVTDKEDLSLYATSAGPRKFLMAVNKSPKSAFKTTVNLGEGVTGKFKLDIHQLSSKEYQWSENLYRAVINKGPTHLKGSVPVGNRFQYTFPPYSITCLELVPVQ